MKIFNNLGYKILDIQVDDNSYRHRVIMGEHSLTLYYSLAEHVEIPVGSYCVYQGETYTLERPEAFKMKHSRLFEYTVTLEASQAKAKIWKFRNTVDGRLKFSLTAKPKEHLQMFVDNMNRRSFGWTIGECVEGTETLISYDHAFCLDALAQMADIFNTEFEIIGKRVSLRKVEYNKNNPLSLSYGRGNGFKPNVGRSNYGENVPVEILYVQGGTENLDPSKYGASELLLPKSQKIGFDGQYFSDEEGFNEAAARYYMVDNAGLSIMRSDKNLSSLAEDSLDASEHYPKRIGKVSGVLYDEESGYYDIIDNSIPDALNFEDCLIEGETMTIIFQSGMLAGREFEVRYVHEKKGDKDARRFEIVPAEIDGQTMPNTTFAPKEGNTYAVFNCTLPDAYICDNETRSGASWDMFRSAVRYLFDNEEQKFSFTGELDGLWAKKNWGQIGGKIKLGGYVLFSDERFQAEGVLVRITGVKDYINNPHSPSIELSNSTVSCGFSTSLKQLESEEVLVEDYRREALQFTKRRFRDAKETMTMLEKALLDNFTGSINPITVQTMSMLVGDESLQFRFVDSMTEPSQVAHAITYDGKAKQLKAAAGIIQHMTLGISSVSSEHKVSEYRFWNISEYESGVLDDRDKKYYLYAKVSQTDQTGVFLLSATAIGMEDESGYYHLLVGVLNSEYDGVRSFATLYGFTEVLPARITTDRVVSGDGQSYFDMVANALKLGSALDFNSQGDGKLRLQGTIVQSQSGSEEYIGCFRGVYNDTYIYYQGDEVTFTENGLTSTYRYIYDTPSKGILPSNETYWQVIAQGSKGEDGIDGTNGIDGISPNTAYKSTVFIRSNKAPEKPTGGSYSSPVPSGWSDGIPVGEAILWASTRIFSSDGLDPQQSSWTTPRQMTDTANFDVIFSSVESPSAPSGHPNGEEDWVETADETTIWMATSTKSNGVWGDWQVIRIKGEKGEDGTSIKVKGTLLSEDDLPETPSDPSDCYIIDKNLWVWDGDSWVNVGQFKGENGIDGVDGTNGKNAYVHIKYANSLTEGDWSENNGETPSKYIGIYADNLSYDQLVWSLYSWSKWKGDDGFGYEYIYKRTKEYIAPDTPSDVSQADDYIPSGWTDDPNGVSEEYPYEWMCYRKKTDGVWGAFIGSYSDNTKASLRASFSFPINPNLLKQTEFESAEKLEKWVVHNGNVGSGRDGFNSFYGKPTPSAVYTELLKQIVYKSSSEKVLENEQWYTLSFLAKGVSRLGFYVYETSAIYGFGTREVYLIAGQTVEFAMLGKCNSSCIEESRWLRTYIYLPDWSWSTFVDIISTTMVSVEKTFTAPTTGVYKINSYVYPKTSDGTTTEAQATVTAYMLNRGNRFASYIYPSAIDTEAGCYVDGVHQTVPTDGCVNWGLTTDWVRHTFTFKTGSISELQQVLFRMTSHCNGLYICQPKLEVGKNATAYCPSSQDMHSPYYEYRYAKNGSTTTPPNITTTVVAPSGWSTTQPSISTGEYLWMTIAKKDTTGKLLENWSTPVRVTPYDGQDGQDGEDGKSPVMVYRGVYDSSKTYYGNTYRLDCVKSGDTYYIARIDAGTFSSVAPPDTTKWNSFGASFESVATNLLLAELANIAGFIFKNDRLISQKGTLNGQPSNNYADDNFIPNLTLDGVNGDGIFRGIIHSSLNYTSVKIITSTPYYINPAEEPYNWFFVNENRQRYYIYLPKAADYDGLEINILNKQSNWKYEESDLYVAVKEDDSLFFKSNVYGIWNGATPVASVENYDAKFVEESGAYIYCPPNQHCVFKSIGGSWYVIKGIYTGE